MPVHGLWVFRAPGFKSCHVGLGLCGNEGSAEGAPTLLGAAAHHHTLPPAATVPKPPFRDSTSHPAASARGAQPGCYIAAHGGEGLGWMGGRMG